MQKRLSNVFSIYRPIDFLLTYFRHLLNENIRQHYELEISLSLSLFLSPATGLDRPKGFQVG